MKDKKEQYRKQIAESFVNVLEEQGLGWVKGWNTPALSSPYNGVTNYKYKGINRFGLALTAIANGYGDPRYYTFNQIVDEKYHPNEKWHLKKGSKASLVQYYFPYDEKEKKALTWEEYQALKDNTDSMRNIVLRSKYYYVYNASQIDGIQPLEKVINEEIDDNELLNKMASSLEINIHYDGMDRAFYSPSTDEIHLPSRNSFISNSSYIGVALHELSHATGHEKRLNRSITNPFGSEEYAKEELIAEISAALLSSEFSDEIDFEKHHELDNSKAYVQNWMKAVKEDSNVLIEAIKKATEASDYILKQSGLKQELEVEKLEPSYTILQVKSEYIYDYGFEAYDVLKRYNKVLSLSHYEVVYDAPLKDNSLEDIYYKFNVDHPNDYFGRSLSISDLIVLTHEDKVSIHYCDITGFKDVTNELIDEYRFTFSGIDIKQLSAEIYDFCAELDPYEERDYLELRIQTINKIKQDLRISNVGKYRESINEAYKLNNDYEAQKKAKELQKKIDNFLCPKVQKHETLFNKSSMSGRKL